MRLSRIAPAACASAAILVFAATPASVATPSTAYFAEWTSTELFSVTSDTLVTEAIGPVGVTGIAGLDVDADTGLGYAVSYDDEPTVLYSVDLNTYHSAPGVEIRYEDETPVLDCTALDYMDPWIVIACGDGFSEIGTVDPDTGVFTPFIYGAPRVGALATNPATSVLYGFGYDGEVYIYNGDAYEVVAESDAEFLGADFTADGTELWLVAYLPAAVPAELLGATTHTLAFTSEQSGDIRENITSYDGDGPTAPAEEAPVQEETLPDTGAEAGWTIAAASAAVLAGAALLLTRRRLARR